MTRREPPVLTVRQTVGVVEPRLIQLDVETYLKGVVPFEMPSSWPMAALLAQAVAARTYALATRKHRARGETWDVCDTECCQVWRPSPQQARANDAIAATSGMVGITRDTRRLVPMFFSASCGGQTINTWAPTYLKATACPCGRETRGHRHGLCQYGAKALAEAGYSFLDILHHYFDLDIVPNYGE